MRLPSFRGTVSPLLFPPLALALIFSQHGLVLALSWMHNIALRTDWVFWLLPMRRMAMLPEVTALQAGLACAFSLLVAWGLALLCFRRAGRSAFGHGLATLAIVPGLQMAAVPLLALLPPSAPAEAAEAPPPEGRNTRHIVQGVIAGVAIIVAAVLISAVSFGAYGWGLFVLTPFTVGVTTAYIVNRRTDIGAGETLSIVLGSAALGCLALLMLALEGFMCILLIIPLGAVAAAVGAALGYSIAAAGHKRGRPFFSVALLPAVFAFDAAMPPEMHFATNQSIEIAAPPAAVWRELVGDAPIAAPPGLVGRAGLAYPVGGRIVRAGAGGERIGFFSTGAARERITEWSPGRRLAVTVIEQPPAMEEMSPYRRVHAPHVEGYFETGETSFDLEATPGGGTRLTIRAEHVLRIDPVLYWDPLARWAAGRNTARVLEDLKARAEA